MRLKSLHTLHAQIPVPTTCIFCRPWEVNVDPENTRTCTTSSKHVGLVLVLMPGRKEAENRITKVAMRSAAWRYCRKGCCAYQQLWRGTLRQFSSSWWWSSAHSWEPPQTTAPSMKTTTTNNNNIHNIMGSQNTFIIDNNQKRNEQPLLYPTFTTTNIHIHSIHNNIHNIITDTCPWMTCCSHTHSL